ncbi:hypothetical protein T10_8805, partial [Trichinella papuae]
MEKEEENWNKHNNERIYWIESFVGQWCSLVKL